MGRDDSELMIISFSWIEPGQLGTHDSLILFISTTRIIGINSVNSQNGRAALEQPNEIHIAWLPQDVDGYPLSQQNSAEGSTVQHNLRSKCIQHPTSNFRLSEYLYESCAMTS